VFFNGVETAFDAYNIDGNNFFKLRDIAYMFNGTGSQFDLSWDGVLNAISVMTGRRYTIVGGEMSGRGTRNVTAQSTTAAIFIDGRQISVTAFNINGNNYFRLADLIAPLNFTATYDAGLNAVIMRTR
jgi:hypothetical protein